MSRRKHSGSSDILVERIANEFVPELHMIALFVLEKNSAFTSTFQALSHRLKTLNNENQTFQQRIKELEIENGQLRKDKEKALLRLSEIAGTRMKEDNPGITDLSDENRPQKLGERFSEIYDNEWTDALEVLSRNSEVTEDIEENETDIIQILLNKAKECFIFCKELSKKQVDHLFLHYGENDDDNDDAQRCRKERKKLPEGTTNQLKEIRKRIAPYVLNTLKDKYHRDVRSTSVINIDQRELIKFTDACLECFWLSVIQDPPVSFNFDIKQFSEFNQSNVRQYTKAGKYVKYTVWPTMYLYEGGPVLLKGVVQCTNNIPQ